MRDHIIWRAVGDNLGVLRRCIVREGVGLALAGTCCNELGRVEIGDLPLHNAAVVGDRGACFGHVGAVDGEGGIFQCVSFGELYGDILAPAKIDEFGGFSVDDRSGWGFFTAARGVGVAARIAAVTARGGARIIVATARIVSTRGCRYCRQDCCYCRRWNRRYRCCCRCSHYRCRCRQKPQHFRQVQRLCRLR